MIIALLFLWLLLGLLAALIIRKHDGGIPLLAFIIFIVCGGGSLLIVFCRWLMEIQI